MQHRLMNTFYPYRHWHWMYAGWNPCIYICLFIYLFYYYIVCISIVHDIGHYD